MPIQRGATNDRGMLELTDVDVKKAQRRIVKHLEKSDKKAAKKFAELFEIELRKTKLSKISELLRRGASEIRSSFTIIRENVEKGGW